SPTMLPRSGARSKPIARRRARGIIAFLDSRLRARNSKARGHTRDRPREGRMHKQWIGCVGIALAILVFSAPASAQQVAQAAANGVLASAQFSQDPDLRCDLLEVKRVSGGALLVRWRIINTAGQAGAGGFASTSGGKVIPYRFSWEQLFVIDPAENKKYLPLTDSKNDRIAEVWEG